MTELGEGRQRISQLVPNSIYGFERHVSNFSSLDSLDEWGKRDSIFSLFHFLIKVGRQREFWHHWWELSGAGGRAKGFLAVLLGAVFSLQAILELFSFHSIFSLPCSEMR